MNLNMHGHALDMIDAHMDTLETSHA
jgi:hypothetical protein